jgi:hypothetical protein
MGVDVLRVPLMYLLGMLRVEEVKESFLGIHLFEMMATKRRVQQRNQWHSCKRDKESAKRKCV